MIFIRLIPLMMGVILPLQAQDAPAELRNDISELIAGHTAARIRSAAANYGKAFLPDECARHFESAFSAGQVIEDESKTDCPAATYWSNQTLKQFERRDYDANHTISRMREILKQDTPDEETEAKRLHALYVKIAKVYRPILRQREASKETEILQANAAREGVQTLDFGVQMEIEPGDTNLKDINRGTRETGVAFYTRMTRKLAFTDLPEAIRLQIDNIPAARSWTFWVPAHAHAQLAAHKANLAQKAQEQRSAMMQRLVGKRRKPSAATTPTTPTPAAPEDEATMVKIKVWKDDPNSPVQTLPDVTTDMF